MSDLNVNDTIEYYSSSLVPVLKRKNADMSILICELESSMLMQQKKINDLEVRCKNLEDKIVKNSEKILENISDPIKLISNKSKKNKG
jgi:hypothetical protein